MGREGGEGYSHTFVSCKGHWVSRSWPNLPTQIPVETNSPTQFPVETPPGREYLVDDAKQELVEMFRDQVRVHVAESRIRRNLKRKIRRKET